MITKNSKHIAITFGPITRLASSVRSTKGLWASSYFFSYLAKCIITPFRKRKFIVPIVDDVLLWQNDNGIGRFPDRYIFQSEVGDFECLTSKTVEVRDQFIEEIFSFFGGKYPKENIKKFIYNYIKIYAFEKECISNNIAKECESILDLMEMQDSFNLEEPVNYLSLMFDNTALSQSFIAQEAFMKTDQVQLFDSLDTIAKTELKGKPDDKTKPYHSYIAIIKADGDNMGETIKSLLDKGKAVIDLSKLLLEFGINAIQTIEKYEARLIFLGGDDLLVFAPVKNGNSSVFSLIEALNNDFNNSMAGLDVKPTLSFGLSITYDKFPMGEALEIAEHCLNEAKNDNFHPYKNTVVFNVQKHSGQSFSAFLEKNTATYPLFLSLINTYTADDEDIINSIMYWLGHNDAILKSILKLDEESGQEQRLENYFDNSFNEDVHSSLQPFFKTLRNFLIVAYHDARSNDEATSENEDKEEKAKEAIAKLYSALRFIHFIKNKRDEQ